MEAGTRTSYTGGFFLMAGKGDKRRPMKIPQEEYAKNWDRIFKKKKKEKK